VKVNLPEGLKFNQISCVDFKNKKFYAYLMSDKNEIYILTQDDYQMVKWPVEGYNLKNCDLKIYGDLFNYLVVIESNEHVKAITLTPDYKLVDSYTESWTAKTERTEGKVFASLFPAQLSMTSNDSKFIRFYPTFSNGYNWIFMSIFMLALHLAILYWRKANLKKHVVDLAIIAVCGVFGFLAVNLFPNKFFK